MVEHKASALQLDVLAQEFLADPYPMYRLLREHEPVHWIAKTQSNGSWLLTRFSDVQNFLKWDKLSAGSGRGATTLNVLSPQQREKYGGFVKLLQLWLLFTDPPKHTRLRKLSNKGFTREQTDKLCGFIEELTHKLLDGVEHKGRCDFLCEVAYPLPAMIIVELLGVPQSDRDLLVRWSNDISLLVGLGALDLEAVRRIEKSYLEMTHYFRRHIEDLRQNPQDNVLSALIHAHEDGDQFTVEELYAQCVLLLIGGHETTKNLIGNALYLLLSQPHLFHHVQDNLSLVDSLVEEVLRYESPVQMVGRVAVADVEINQQVIQKGQHVLLAIGAANRDPEYFPHPEEFDIERIPNKHLAFGAGPHFCLGAPLARLQAQIALRLVIQRFPRMCCIQQQFAWLNSPVFRGLTSLEIEVN